MVSTGCGGASARSCARGKGWPAKKSVRVGKQGREEASVYVLKPRGMLHGRIGAGDTGGSGGGDATWSSRGKPARGQGSGGEAQAGTWRN
jgi:hypothetical protein